MTDELLEEYINFAAYQMGLFWDHGDRDEAREWAEKLRGYVAQRSAYQVRRMESAMGLR